MALVPLATGGDVDDIEIVTLVGTFQTDLGCPHDWDPSCTQTTLQDAHGDGVYELSTRRLPRGLYECSVVVNERWTASYGEGGDRDGPNVVFEVTEDRSVVTFTYDSYAHVLSVKERVALAESETTCESNQECRDKLGSDWECDSGLCVRTGEDNDDTTFFCGFSTFLGNEHPALDTLRRFRDEVLRKHALGRRLIELYYRNQSAVFAFIEQHPTLKECAARLIESSVPVLEFFMDDGGRHSRQRD